MFKKFFKQDKTAKPVVKEAFLVAYEQNLLQLADHHYDKETMDDFSTYGRLRAREFMEFPAESFLAVRYMIAGSVSEMGKFGALLLSPDDDPMKLIELPGISGDLRPHLCAIIQKEDFMDWHNLSETSKQDDDVIYSKALLNYHATWAASQAWNYVRAINLKDVSEPDWLQPFIAAMYGWHEYRFRKLMELPLTLEVEHEKAKEAPDHYYAFLEIVKSGVPHPVDEWLDPQEV